MQQPSQQPEQRSVPVPRRQALRSLIGVVTGLAALVGLTACGGDDGDDEDD